MSDIVFVQKALTLAYEILPAEKVVPMVRALEIELEATLGLDAILGVIMLRDGASSRPARRRTRFRHSSPRERRRKSMGRGI